MKVIYFPMEAKFSIWDENYNLVKEWFNSREEALLYIEKLQ